jgi:pilin isopeptide linkage protein
MEPDDVPESMSGKLGTYDYYKGPSLGDAATVTQEITSASLNQVDTYYKNKDVTGASEAKVVPGISQNSVKGIKLDEEFDLSGLTFTDEGVYRYKVSEVADEKSSDTINYDDTKFIVDLYVGWIPDGNTQKLGIEYAVSQTLSGTKKPIVFENKFMTSSIVIEKQIDGSMADPDQEFTFWIKIPEGGDSIDLAEGATINASIYEAGAEPVPNNILVGGSMEEEDSTNDAYVAEKTAATGWRSFTLKGGQSLIITGIPAGMVYYLFEEDYQSEGYDTTHVIRQNVTTVDKSEIIDKGSNLGKQQTSEGVNYVGFLNTKNSTPGTGIVLDIMPYVVIVLVAAAGILLFISRKKRNAR